MAGCVALLAAPSAALPQPAGKVYRIGSLTRGGQGAAAPYNRALEEGLARLGWVGGRNIVFEHRYADLKPERYPELAAELMRLGVWTCPGFVDTWVKLPMLLVRAAARTLGD